MSKKSGNELAQSPNPTQMGFEIEWNWSIFALHFSVTMLFDSASKSPVAANSMSRAQIRPMSQKMDGQR
jgi:hypothetical protein